MLHAVEGGRVVLPERRIVVPSLPRGHEHRPSSTRSSTMTSSSAPEMRRPKKRTQACPDAQLLLARAQHRRRVSESPVAPKRRRATPILQPQAIAMPVGRVEARRDGEGARPARKQVVVLSALGLLFVHREGR